MVCTLISHRNDIKMFKIQVEPQAAGKWFHCMVINYVQKEHRPWKDVIDLFSTITWKVLTSISIEVSRRIAHARKRKIAGLHMTSGQPC